MIFVGNGRILTISQLTIRMGMGTKLAKGTLVAITKYRSVDGGVVHALRQIVRVLVGVVCLVWVPSSV